MTDERLSEIDLLPCPFCGQGAEMVHEASYDYPEQRETTAAHVAVQCTSCSATGSWHYYEASAGIREAMAAAVAAWNRRAALSKATEPEHG